MSTLLRRSMSTAAVTLAAVALSAVATIPAHAGGPGQIYVFGSTRSSCETNLSNSIHSQQAHGREISGVHHCRKAGDGKRWFGDYVAN